MATPEATPGCDNSTARRSPQREITDHGGMDRKGSRTQVLQALSLLDGGNALAHDHLADHGRQGRYDSEDEAEGRG